VQLLVSRWSGRGQRAAGAVTNLGQRVLLPGLTDSDTEASDLHLSPEAHDPVAPASDVQADEPMAEVQVDEQML
jgi:hypothetical protein